MQGHDFAKSTPGRTALSTQRLGGQMQVAQPWEAPTWGRGEGGERAEGQGQKDRLASVTCVASVRRPYRHPLTANPLAGVQGRQGGRLDGGPQGLTLSRPLT